jgi:multimeric flavodoxin WrbA
MPNVLVLYYSSYGHIELMAGAQAEGAARIPNVRVLVKRVPETVPPEIAKTSGFKLDQTALRSWRRCCLPAAEGSGRLIERDFRPQR